MKHATQYMTVAGDRAWLWSAVDGEKESYGDGCVLGMPDFERLDADVAALAHEPDKDDFAGDYGAWEAAKAAWLESLGLGGDFECIQAQCCHVPRNALTEADGLNHDFSYRLMAEDEVAAILARSGPPRADIIRLAEEWSGDETMDAAIARAYNVDPDAVTVDFDGDVHIGDSWLDDDDLAALPAKLAALGYSVD